MAGLKTCDCIRVLTQNGESVIELLIGDITKLQKKDKVDVVFVSAFYGDYTPTRSSLIGALYRNLGVSVGDLSRDKEEDLRKLYSCWWSKPLPDNVPYNRVLCFETKSFSKAQPQEMVADAFRCLVAILNNKDGTVVTPLLNTGDQGYGKVVMIQGMVEAAVRWMKAGLPLRLLKIVLFAANTDVGDIASIIDRAGYTRALKAFVALKEKYDMQYMMPKHVTLEFDFYLSYSNEDQDVVDAIVKDLQEAKSDVRIFSSRQTIDTESAWQEDMYEVMTKSARVITVLSPSYMESTACLEQYNIALCCNRKAQRDMLAPIYVVSLPVMPTYMGLVQYVDCRFKNFQAISEACKQIVVSLSVTVATTSSLADVTPIQYDVFLSYSHKDSEKAKRIVELLQKRKPSLRIFFDVQELKTGKAWQRALYHSIDGSKCMIALITNSYLKSAVCQEEFNLALAKHCDKSNELQLIPVLLEHLDHIPVGFSRLSMVSAVEDQFTDVANTLCSGVVDWLETGKVPSGDGEFQGIFAKDKNICCNIDDKFENIRSQQFQDKFKRKDDGVVPPNFPPSLTDIFSKPKKHSDDTECDVALCFDKGDEKYANFILAVLKAFAPGLNVRTKYKDDIVRLETVENTKRIVSLLSPDFTESAEKVEELHIAIWRQRMSHPSAPILFPIQVHMLPKRPTYFHLLPNYVSLPDTLWAELAGSRQAHLPNSVHHAVASVEKLKDAEELALFVAVFHLLNLFERERTENIPSQEVPRPSLLNLFNLTGTAQDDVQPALVTLQSNSPVALLSEETDQVSAFSYTTSVKVSDIDEKFQDDEHHVLDNPHQDSSKSGNQSQEGEQTDEAKISATEVQEETESDSVSRHVEKLSLQQPGEDASESVGAQKDQGSKVTRENKEEVNQEGVGEMKKDGGDRIQRNGSGQFSDESVKLKGRQANCPKVKHVCYFRNEWCSG